MSSPPRALTNNYKDCKLIRLESKNPRSPLIVAQEGCDPNDPKCRMRMFYLQRDGRWIEEVARSVRPESESLDLVFESSSEALQVLSHSFSKPVVRDLPVNEADIQAYLSKLKGSSPEELLRQFLGGYRALSTKS